MQTECWMDLNSILCQELFQWIIFLENSENVCSVIKGRKQRYQPFPYSQYLSHSFSLNLANNENGLAKFRLEYSLTILMLFPIVCFIHLFIHFNA